MKSGADQRYKLAVRLLRNKLKDRPCFDCDVSYPYYVMDFDHRDPVTKSHEVSDIKSIKRLLDEAQKCNVVCANCHRIRSYKRRVGWKYY